jgi:ABC-type multidrug transport system permease subunit
MADAQDKEEYDKRRFFKLYNLSLSYLMVCVLSIGLFIGMFLAYLFFKPVQLYLYVAIASFIILVPSLIGFIRTYLLAKKELKLMHKNGGQMY